MITLDDVQDFGTSWFNAVAAGASAAEQAQFFFHPHARIYVIWNGATVSLEDHEKLHAQWINERHPLRPFRSHAAECIAGARACERHRLLAGRVSGPACAERDQGGCRRGLAPRACDLR